MKQLTYFETSKNNLAIQSLNELLDNTSSLSILNEEDAGVLSTITGGLSQAWKGITDGWNASKNAIKGNSAWNSVVGWVTGKNADGTPLKNGEGAYSLANGIQKIGKLMSDNPNWTTAGLLGAGILGTYYLLKKRKEKKQIDPKDFQYAMQLDRLKQVPTNMAGKPVNLRDCI